MSEEGPIHGTYFAEVKCVPRRCPNCGNPAPVNALTTSVTCPECEASVEIAPSAWAPVLLSSVNLRSCRIDDGERHVGAGKQGSGGSVAKVEGTTHKSPPLCIHGGCGAELPVDQPVQDDAPFMLTCSECGQENHFAVAPDWARKTVKGLTHVLSEDSTEGGEAPALEVDLDRPEPVSLDCDNCGARLKITQEHSRLTECEHCGSSFYLPKEVWQRFHPVKTAARFFLRAHFRPTDFRKAGKVTAIMGLVISGFLFLIMGLPPLGATCSKWADTPPDDRTLGLTIGICLSLPAVICGLVFVWLTWRHFKRAKRVVD